MRRGYYIAAALRQYAYVKSKGRYVAQHSCGDCREVFPDLEQYGLDIYNTFQPEVYDIEYFKRRFGGSITFFGGISTQTLLPFASPEELEQEVSQLPYVLENIVLGVPDGGDERDPVVTLKLVYNPDSFPGKTSEEIYDLVKNDVEKINDTTPPYKRIRKIIVTDEPMIKTSTGKVRRFMELQKITEENA